MAVCALHSGTESVRFADAKSGLSGGWVHTIITTLETAHETKLLEWNTPFDVILNYSPATREVRAERAKYAVAEGARMVSFACTAIGASPDAAAKLLSEDNLRDDGQ